MPVVLSNRSTFNHDHREKVIDRVPGRPGNGTGCPWTRKSFSQIGAVLFSDKTPLPKSHRVKIKNGHFCNICNLQFNCKK